MKSGIEYALQIISDLNPFNKSISLKFCSIKFYYRVSESDIRALPESKIADENSNFFSIHSSLLDSPTIFISIYLSGTELSK